jgi:hypothetical protein
LTTASLTQWQDILRIPHVPIKRDPAGSCQPVLGSIFVIQVVIFPFEVPIVGTSTMMVIIKELEAEKRHYSIVIPVATVCIPIAVTDAALFDGHVP